MSCFWPQIFRYLGDGPDKSPKGLFEPLSHLKVKYGFTSLRSDRPYFPQDISPYVVT